MIVIHHLGVSQSDRVVWLMEELGLPYELKWYDRKPDLLLPDSYLALHPAATAPVIQDGDLTLTESAVILEHICHRHADGRLTVTPDQANYVEYLYWMHFHNNLLGLFFAKLALPDDAEGPEFETIVNLVRRREENYFRHLNQWLAASPYLAGEDFTCADIMVTFDLAELPLFGGRSIDDLPNVRGYVNRICERPAYRKAMEIRRSVRDTAGRVAPRQPVSAADATGKEGINRAKAPREHASRGGCRRLRARGIASADRCKGHGRVRAAVSPGGTASLWCHSQENRAARSGGGRSARDLPHHLAPDRAVRADPRRAHGVDDDHRPASFDRPSAPGGPDRPHRPASGRGSLGGANGIRTTMP